MLNSVMLRHWRRRVSVCLCTIILNHRFRLLLGWGAHCCYEVFMALACCGSYGPPWRTLIVWSFVIRDWRQDMPFPQLNLNQIIATQGSEVNLMIRLFWMQLTWSQNTLPAVKDRLEVKREASKFESAMKAASVHLGTRAPQYTHSCTWLDHPLSKYSLQVSRSSCN